MRTLQILIFPLLFATCNNPTSKVTNHNENKCINVKDFLNSEYLDMSLKLISIDSIRANIEVKTTNKSLNNLLFYIPEFKEGESVGQYSFEYYDDLRKGFSPIMLQSDDGDIVIIEKREIYLNENNSVVVSSNKTHCYQYKLKIVNGKVNLKGKKVRLALKFKGLSFYNCTNKENVSVFKDSYYTNEIILY